MEISFQEVNAFKHIREGVASDVKLLLKEEKAVQHNIDTKGDKAKMLAEIQAKLSMRIALNVWAKIEPKIHEILIRQSTI